MELAGSFLGKNIILYDPKIECSEGDCRKFISQFNRIETLRSICTISCQLFCSQNIFKFRDVPVSEGYLYDFAYRVIKYCDDNALASMSDSQIELALKMCHKLYDMKSEGKDAIEILMESSYRQFIFQQKDYNNFTRNYYLFTDLWGRVAPARGIDIQSEIESMIGIPYDCVLLFVFALAGNNYGHFWLYDENMIKEINEQTGLSLTVEFHRKFIEWCCGTYEQILSQSNQSFPLLRYPIIKTNFKPITNKDEVFMLLSKQLLYNKLTSSLYFYMIDRFNKGDNKNKFKELIGYVFQEYIGELLRFYFKSWKVIPEIRYKKGSNFQDSVDWFVVKDDKLIMIEVKQSSIFYGSKYNPSIYEIKTDLKKTIIPAIKQLNTTEIDIREKKYTELYIFDNIKSIIKLIVVNDPLFNANFLVKTIFKDEFTDLSFQIININEFETLLSIQRELESLFDILNNKILQYNEMDFNEYIRFKFPNARSDIEFLAPIWNRFFRNKLHIKEGMESESPDNPNYV